MGIKILELFCVYFVKLDIFKNFISKSNAGAECNNFWLDH